jgi:hypothetical protein
MDTEAYQGVIVAEDKASPNSFLQCVVVKMEALAVIMPSLNQNRKFRHK